MRILLHLSILSLTLLQLGTQLVTHMGMLFNQFPVDQTVSKGFSIRVLQVLEFCIWAPQYIINGCVIDQLGFFGDCLFSGPNKKKMHLLRNSSFDKAS